MSEIKPLPADPSNQDLAESLLSLHGCLETHIKETKKGFKIAKKEREAINVKVDTINTGIDSVKRTIVKTVGAAATAVLIGLIGVGFNSWKLAANTDQAVSAKTTNRYTSVDAAHDRDAQNIINAEILSRLSK